ncbi:hypothetical protein BC831DRAFT_512925 [Entophlyctis helioformis]|nr:hypothetical protein BC831DRAFT_512925 [Entophlyctis helioformis]
MSFTEEALVAKLRGLTNTQQSIQVTSQWFIFHRKNAKSCVATWSQEIANAQPSKRLNYMHLANDIIQNSRRRGEEYIEEFKTVLPNIFATTLKNVDSDTKHKVQRLIDIWRKRSLYSDDFLDRLLQRAGLEVPRPSRPKPPQSASAPVSGSGSASLDAGSAQSASRGSLPPSTHAAALNAPHAQLPNELQSMASRFEDLKGLEMMKLPLVTKVNGLRESIFEPDSNPSDEKRQDVEQARSLLDEHLKILTSEMSFRALFASELRSLAGQQDSIIGDLQRQQQMVTERLKLLGTLQSAFPPSTSSSSSSSSNHGSGFNTMAGLAGNSPNSSSALGGVFGTNDGALSMDDSFSTISSSSASGDANGNHHFGSNSNSHSSSSSSGVIPSGISPPVASLSGMNSINPAMTMGAFGGIHQATLDRMALSWPDEATLSFDFSG